MRPEQERVKNLLLDTVTLLCRNGLTYRCELKIQGLLGITLDDEEVFVVHINETISDNIEEIHDTNRIDVDPIITDIRTVNESFTELNIPAVDQAARQIDSSAQNLDSGLQEYEDITSESGALVENYATDASEVAGALEIMKHPVIERSNVKVEKVTPKGAKTAQPLIEIASNGNADALVKQINLQHEDLIKINTTTLTPVRPAYINQMSSPAKLGGSNGVVGNVACSMQAGDIRPTKRPHNSTEQFDGLRPGESDDDDDEDDDDDSSVAEGFTVKRRRSLPSITYPVMDPSGSTADMPESKPYIPDFTPGVINPWQSVTSGIATGGGGRNYNGDNSGGSFGGISLSNNAAFAADIAGMFSVAGSGGSSILTNEQIMAKQREYYLARNNHHSANSRLPRRPRESEEKHFGCPFCGLSYYYKKHLKFHLKQKHGL